MKFGEYTFMHNPKTLTVQSGVLGSKRIYPFSDSLFKPICLDNAVVSGSGVITGEDCFEKLLRLLDCLGGEGRLLSVSPFPSVRAVLTSLKYSLSPSENLIDIDFSFTCSSSSVQGDVLAVKSVTAKSTETLWDIGYKYGVAVEELLRLNTFVKRPDELEKGWVIRLC